MKFEIRKVKKGWRVYLFGANHKKICWTEIYNSLESAREAVELIKASADAPIAYK